jgi:hypothetical protein
MRARHARVLCITHDLEHITIPIELHKVSRVHDLIALCERALCQHDTYKLSQCYVQLIKSCICRVLWILVLLALPITKSCAFNVPVAWHASNAVMRYLSVFLPALLPVARRCVGARTRPSDLG